MFLVDCVKVFFKKRVLQQTIKLNYDNFCLQVTTFRYVLQNIKLNNDKVQFWWDFKLLWALFKLLRIPKQSKFKDTDMPNKIDIHAQK